jgi:metallophosphoesterase (TIGR03767 family)
VSGAPPPPLTVQRRLGAGSVLRTGSGVAYRQVRELGGEPHTVRTDVVPFTGPAATTAGCRCLLSLAHITDLQLADVQSPARFEFFNREYTDPRFAKLVPVQRPQEALTPHAVDAMVATLNRIEGGPVTGAPLQLAVTTGDAIDNAQWNELQALLALFDGGLVRAGSGGARYEGVQSLDWPDNIFWRPDGVGAGGPDVFRSVFGFPHHPRLLDLALADFAAGGLRLPWLACYGNHEALIQGVGVVTPGVSAALVGNRKSTRLPDGADRDRALELFTASSEVFLGSDDIMVTPDPQRRPIGRGEFVAAHFAAGARPHGHGFTERNLRDGTAYYCHDLPGVRLIGLDTTCQAGGADGSLDRDQFRWLEERLVEVHSAYRGADGSMRHPGHEDRLVVLFSHHGLDSLTNSRVWHHGDSSLVVGAAELRALLHRFRNVVLWLNGHTHTNGVRSRVDPDQPGHGFWEVTTCALVDWPCQARLVELVDPGGGLLLIACTMVDHDSPLSPHPGWPGTVAQLDRASLAGLHRELAGNVPWSGFDSPLAGTHLDRNVMLPLRAPFPLNRLASDSTP